MSQKMELFITTALRTSIPSYLWVVTLCNLLKVKVKLPLCLID
jgi:hypothetical protein